MSASKRRIVSVAAFLLFLSSPAQAIVPDPVEAGLLAKIVATLEMVQELRLRVLDKLQEQVYNRLRGYAFPATLFGQIKATASSVVSIRRELQRLTCDWPPSPRTAGLRESLLRRLQFCRSSYHEIWGTHERLWDGQLQELNDYVSTMTANMISERIQKADTSWVRAHHDLFDGHVTERDSPGEAIRAEAAAMAWTNEVAVGNSQILTQNLLVQEMDRALDRFDQKKAADLSHYAYRGLGTLAGGRLDLTDEPSQETAR